MPTQTESTAQVRAAEVKWQTVLPAIWSQRRRDVGCATATVATDANVVTMSPDVALLAGTTQFGRVPKKFLVSQPGHLGTNFNKIFTEIHACSFTKIHLKMLSGKWWPFCLSLNVLRLQTDMSQ